MTINDSDILAAARELRDEQNQRLNVALSPSLRRRMPMPLWWAATAAAVVVAFFAGRSLAPSTSHIEGSVYTSGSEMASATSGNDSPLPMRAGAHEVASTIHDTIYLTRVVHVPSAANAAHSSHLGGGGAPEAAVMPNDAPSEYAPAPDTAGCSMYCDDIRYDLLAVN